MGTAKKKANDLGFQRVSAKELREFSKLALPDETLSTGYSEARVLPDGRVLYLDLLAGRKRGSLLPSRAAAEEWKRRMDETKRLMVEQAAGRIPHPAVTLLPPIDDFLRDVEAHARSLGPRLRIPDETLDGSVASLGAVDKALKRIPLAERPVADLVTPLVAYVGEVLRKASGGRWIKVPPTYTEQEAVYAPGEWEAYCAALHARRLMAEAAAKKAEAEAKARRASKSDVALAVSAAISAACEAFNRESNLKEPKPIRFDMVEKPRRDSGNEPVVVAGNGQSFDPFGDVFIPMIEPSKRPPLRATVETRLGLAGYPQAPKPAA
jgi:hypothetical protein